ncbi:hypothetical protein Tco_1038026, partial [Tanacetum coccineum]
MSENEDKYHDTVLDFEARAKKNVDVVLKIGNSLQGMFMLGPKPMSFYDSKVKHGLGYTNPYTLMKAISQNPKLYDASCLDDSKIQMNVRDTEDILDDATKNFVPQEEFSAEQKYFSSSVISSENSSKASSPSSSSKTKPTVTPMPNNKMHNEIEKIQRDSIEIQEGMQKRINILENDVQRCQKQSLDFELQLQHEKERRKCESSLKSVCETSWISNMEKLESENVSLEFQVQSLIKEQENVKTEYQKLFDSIKTTRTQTQREINELIENVNQKTYAYADVRAQNQDLLITISNVRRPSNIESPFKNSVLCNTKNSSEKLEVSDRKALFTTPRTVKSKFEDTTPVVLKTGFSVKTVQSKSLDTTLVVSKTKITAFTPLSAKHKVSSAFNLRDSSLSNYMKNKIELVECGKI